MKYITFVPLENQQVLKDKGICSLIYRKLEAWMDSVYQPLHTGKTGVIQSWF